MTQVNQARKAVSDPEAIIARMDGGRSDIKYQRDQIVFSQGEAADSAFYVQSGSIKVTVVSEEGKEAVVAILPPGSFCGEECLAGHTLRISTARALTECALVRMAKASIVRALHDDQLFSELLTTYLIQRNIRVQEDLVDQLLNSTEKRLARLLLILANYGKEERPERIVPVPRINQETLAEMIGTSRTHVNFFMNKFRQLGFIDYNGVIKVNRSLLNMLLHEKPQIASRD
jgi:CRP/FNR family cyclic AMP-dependent transcriptional regulator